MTALRDTLVDDCDNWSTYLFCFVLFIGLVCFMFVFGQILVEQLSCNKGLFRSKGLFPR